MARIEWNDKYCVGVEEIDKQHQGLLRIINSLICIQPNEYEEKKFSDSISSLIHYAYTHFATEEKYLTHANYPDQQQHILQHVDFIMKVLSLAMKVEDGNKGNRIELLNYLEKWFSSHILIIDRQYIPFLEAKGINK